MQGSAVAVLHWLEYVSAIGTWAAFAAHLSIDAMMYVMAAGGLHSQYCLQLNAKHIQYCMQSRELRLNMFA